MSFRLSRNVLPSRLPLRRHHGGFAGATPAVAAATLSRARRFIKGAPWSEAAIQETRPDFGTAGPSDERREAREFSAKWYRYRPVDR